MVVDRHLDYLENERRSSRIMYPNSKGKRSIGSIQRSVLLTSFSSLHLSPLMSPCRARTGHEILHSHWTAKPVKHVKRLQRRGN